MAGIPFTTKSNFLRLQNIVAFGLLRQRIYPHLQSDHRGFNNLTKAQAERTTAVQK